MYRPGGTAPDLELSTTIGRSSRGGRDLGHRLGVRALGLHCFDWDAMHLLAPKEHLDELSMDKVTQQHGMAASDAAQHDSERHENECDSRVGQDVAEKRKIPLEHSR